ncbi:MAG: hypothetical protein D3914_07870 [Candidatus Electrothrix sp. LOE2]|jgi:hypothetical protein|nr:hypothetical protein [Candidatus Electrothrix sp. LOE2]
MLYGIKTDIPASCHRVGIMDGVCYTLIFQRKAQLAILSGIIPVCGRDDKDPDNSTATAIFLFFPVLKR